MSRFTAPIAEQIWDMKYRFKGADGTAKDVTVEDTWRRIARDLAQVCGQTFAQALLWAGHEDLFGADPHTPPLPPAHPQQLAAHRKLCPRGHDHILAPRGEVLANPVLLAFGKGQRLTLRQPFRHRQGHPPVQLRDAQ